MKPWSRYAMQPPAALQYSMRQPHGDQMKMGT